MTEEQEKQEEQELEKGTQCPECGAIWDNYEIKLQECFVCGYPDDEGFFCGLDDDGDNGE